MKDMYIITIEAYRDVMGNPCNQLRYAMHKSSGVYFPECGFSCYDAIMFASIEQAEEWFEKNKKYLFEDHARKYKFDISSLAIQKITFNKVAPLSV